MYLDKEITVIQQSRRGSTLKATQSSIESTIDDYTNPYQALSKSVEKPYMLSR